MTDQEREEAQKEREEALLNENLKAFYLSEEEIEELRKQGRI